MDLTGNGRIFEVREVPVRLAPYFVSTLMH